MELFVGGARGTTPQTSAGKEFGGDTTSFLITGRDGTRVIIDAGSGIGNIASKLYANQQDKKLLILFTHYHLDHVSGLPAFPLLYDSAWSIELAAPEREGWTVEKMTREFIQPPWWPVRLSQLRSPLSFHTLPGLESSAPWSWGGLRIRWCPVQHPDGCSAYRVDEPATGKAFVIATDIEWSEASDAQKEALRRLCSEPTPVDGLLFDGQYAEADYEPRRGWGHSTWEEGVALANELGIPSLLLTHHGPLTDEELLAREKEARARHPGTRLARQGMTWP